MAPREELRVTADALDDSVVVCGIGGYADEFTDQEFPNARLSTITDVVNGIPSAVAAVVIAVDPADLADAGESLRGLTETDEFTETDAFTVAVLPESGIGADELAALGRHVDALLLLGSSHGSSSDERTAHTLGDGIREFLEVVQEPGFVNLDLTDARTVLSSGVAALGSGSASRDAPASAVESAFERLPRGVDVATASAVLVDVVVDPVTSIAAATDVIAEVRDRIVTDANVIWGGAVDESADDELSVRIVIADVRYAPPLTAGAACPRCDTPLSTYTFGARTTLSCDACGYSGISVWHD